MAVQFYLFPRGLKSGEKLITMSAPDVTENEKIGPENRADDIKSDEFDRKNMGKSSG